MTFLHSDLYEDWNEIVNSEIAKTNESNKLLSAADIVTLAHSMYHQATFEKNWRRTVDEELERKFQELKQEWEKETKFLSSTTAIIHNINYQYIIGLGPNVIPLLLKDLAQTQNFWFWSLMAISRENPVDQNDVGNIEKMIESWLEWGRRKGYLW